jgi:signal transduction histidine kinase
VLYANKLALDRTQKSFTQVVGHHLNTMDDPEIASQNLQLQREVINRKLPVNGSVEIGTLENRQVFQITYVPVLDVAKNIKEIFRILIDVTTIRLKESQLRALSNQLEKLREEERHRISRDIHDDLGQILTVMKIDLVSLQKKSGENYELFEMLEPIVGLVDSAIDSARRVSFELRPGILDQTGLIPAIEWLLNQSKKHSEIVYHSTLPETGILEIDTEKSVAIYRVLQEILTNISRHSNATKVDISLILTDSTIELTVADNGKGFDFNTHSESLGLLGMRERARIQNGTLEVHTGLKEGTTIILSIPL